MFKVLTTFMRKLRAGRGCADAQRRMVRKELENLFHDDFAAHAMIVKKRKARVAAGNAKAA